MKAQGLKAAATGTWPVQVFKSPVPHLRPVFQQSWVMWKLPVYNLIFYLVPIHIAGPVRNTARNTLSLDRLGSQSFGKDCWLSLIQDTLGAKY